MSGMPATSCTAAVIDPPWLRNAEAPMRSDSYGPADGGRNLAEPIAAKNPASANSTINYFNEIGTISPVRKAGLGCPRRNPKSAETDRFEVVVGLDDFHQAVLG